MKIQSVYKNIAANQIFQNHPSWNQLMSIYAWKIEPKLIPETVKVSQLKHIQQFTFH